MILVLLWALAGAPQSDCLGDGLAALRAAGSRADSLALADRWAGATGDCAALLAGYTIALTSTGAEVDWERRVQGLALIERAVRAYADEPRGFLGLGILLYHRQSRTDAQRALGRALERAGRGTPLSARERAIAHYVLGQIHSDFWRDWRSYGELAPTSAGQWHCGRSSGGNTDNFTSSANDFGWLADLNLACPDVFETNMRTYFLPRASLRRDELARAAEAYNAAFAADPTFAEPLEALLAEYVYLDQWDDAAAVVVRLREALPEAAAPLLYDGIVRHAAGDTRGAGTAFARALGRMADADVRDYTDVRVLLPPEEAERFAAADTLAQATYAQAYWNAFDPLYLTAVNERRVEHYARVATADLLFSSAALQERGRRSFAGRIWIRYGRPRAMREASLPAGRIAFWDYGAGPDIALTRGAAYRSFRPTDAAVEYAERLSRTSPATYAPGFADSTEGIATQLVRTTGADGTPGLLVLAEWPERFAAAEGGLVLLDPNYQPVAQWRGARPAAGGLMSDLQRVPSGAYSLSIEYLHAAERRFARHRDTVTAVAADSGFGVSDLLLARSAGAEGPIGGFGDLGLAPRYAPAVERGGPLVVAWEAWQRDGRARVEYAVELEVQDASRRPVVARILGGLGIGGERQPAARVTFTSERPLVGGTTAEWVALGTDLEPGVYRLVMVFRSGGREVRREREVMVRQ